MSFSGLPIFVDIFVLTSILSPILAVAPARRGRYLDTILTGKPIHSYHCRLAQLACATKSVAPRVDNAAWHPPRPLPRPPPSRRRLLLKLARPRPPPACVVVASVASAVVSIAASSVVPVAVGVGAFSVACAVSVAAPASVASVPSIVAPERVARCGLNGFASVVRLACPRASRGRRGQGHVCPDLVPCGHVDAGSSECIARGRDLAEHQLQCQRLGHA